jgi:hypothetical protein
MYVLVKSFYFGETPSNIFVCAHVPHDGCTLDGCESHIKLVIDGKVLVQKANPHDYQPWTYQKDENFDGECDYCAEKGEENQGSWSDLAIAAYNEVSEYLYSEISLKLLYGTAYIRLSDHKRLRRLIERAKSRDLKGVFHM